MSNSDSTTKSPNLRRYRYRTLREDYIEFCGGNTVAALLLDYFASIERLHGEARLQGERPVQWRNVGGRYGGQITVLKPTPKRETIYRALDVLTAAGLIEAHPDNGKPTKINQRAEPNRFRLLTARLHQLEDQWAAIPQAENDTLEDRGVLLGTGGPALLGTHDSVSLESVKERENAPSLTIEELPDHLSPAQQKAITQPYAPPRPNGDGGALAYTLIEAYCDAWDVTLPRYREQWHRAQMRGANDMAALGATPDEVTAMVAERREKGKQPDQCPMTWMATDYVGWKSRSARDAPAEPAFIDVATEVDDDGVLLTYGIRADGSRELVGRG